MAADSQNCYVSSFSLYLCKEADVPQLNGFGHDIVMKMARPFLKMHRHVFFDNFFMSTKLMDDGSPRVYIVWQVDWVLVIPSCFVGHYCFQRVVVVVY